ncbi:MAG TPA: dihydroorotase [Propionibacteriaceae bacterium]|nr:dihydroorotase [Propionibacteriaceae bacterium]
MGYVVSGARSVDGRIGDLFIEHGLFVDTAPSGATRIDAEGLLVLPGLVDLHTHLREPGREDAETVESGTRAAARGGFTAVHAMANTDPVTDTAERALGIAELGVRTGHTQVVPVGAITVGLEGRELSAIAAMAEVGVRVFSDDGKCVMDAAVMRRALQTVKGFDGVVAQHSQDANLATATACCHEGPVSTELGLEGWPSVAESVIVARDVELAAATGARLHVCHISTAEGVEVVRWAKSRGITVTAEATPHHLYLDHTRLRGLDTTFKVNPPLRPAEDIEAVRAALADGTIDIVGTDHAPHATSDKSPAFPLAKPGMIGLEQALAVVIDVMVNTGRLDWPGVARVMSSRPAEIGRLAGQGQPIAVGSVANLVLVDPSARAIVDRNASASISRNNPYHGSDLPDPVVATIWAGKVTHQR